MVGSHIVVAVHEDVQDVLRLGLPVYEVIGIGDAVIGLVALAIIAQEAREVPCLILSPGLREERVQLLLHCLMAWV